MTLEASIVAGNTAERGLDIFGTLTLLDPSLIEHVPDPDTTLIYDTNPQDPSAYTLAKRSIFGSSPKLGSFKPTEHQRHFTLCYQIAQRLIRYP